MIPDAQALLVQSNVLSINKKPRTSTTLSDRGFSIIISVINSPTAYATEQTSLS